MRHLLTLARHETLLRASERRLEKRNPESFSAAARRQFGQMISPSARSSCFLAAPVPRDPFGSVRYRRLPLPQVSEITHRFKFRMVLVPFRELYR